MKIGIASDLHLEFGQLDVEIPFADVMILAGDILVADDLFSGGRKNEVYEEFARRVNDNANYIVYVPGNHEFYHSEYNEAIDKLKEFCERFGFIWLDNQEVTLDGQHFLGATLWTDCGHAEQRAFIRARMNDYRVIHYGDRLLQVQDTMNMHADSVRFIYERSWSTSIVVTHHLPSFKSIDEQFKYDGHGINNAYATDLEDLIELRQPALWVHGHSHSPKDYMLGQTRIISNPRGYYGHEKIADEFSIKVIDI